MAVAAKGKEPASDTIMSPGDMKPLLALSKREPVHAAIGITADGDGVILLNRRVRPKKLLAMLKSDASKAKIQLQPSSLRFGKAEVDTDYDPGMVRFFLNKAAPGNMRVKLLEVVKRIPYQKVELNIEPSFEDEPDEDAADAPPATAASGATTTTTDAPPPPAPPAMDTSTAPNTATGATPPPAPSASPQTAAPDFAALTTTLGQLMQAIPKVANGDAAVQGTLVGFATTAQASLKAKDAANAAAGIEALRGALAAAMEQAKLGAALAGGAGPVAYGKARLAWVAVRKKLETDLDTLRKHLLEFYKDAGIAGDLDKRYNECVAPVLANLDEDLADTLDAAINATDPAKRAKLVEDAGKTIKRYQNFVASEAIFAELDSNPFVPLAISQTITATLATLAKAVH